MTNQERLMAALFDNPQREHIDIKFFVGGGVDISNEDFCAQAVSMIEQMDAGVDADETFEENIEQREVSDFLAS